MRGYRALLRELEGIVGRESADPDKDEDVRRLVHALLRDGRVQGAWVGVLDDLPPPADLPEHGLGWLLREDADGFPWGSGKTVVTSRSAEWANGYTLGGGGITVGNFEADEASAFLTGVVTHWSPDAEGVAAVGRRLSYFPLALASAAGCAKKFALQPRQYLEELDKQTSQYLDRWQRRKRATGEYLFEYADVVRMTWERLGRGEDAGAASCCARWPFWTRTASRWPSLRTFSCCCRPWRSTASSRCSAAPLYSCRSTRSRSR